MYLLKLDKTVIRTDRSELLANLELLLQSYPGAVVTVRKERK